MTFQLDHTFLMRMQWLRADRYSVFTYTTLREMSSDNTHPRTSTHGHTHLYTLLSQYYIYNWEQIHRFWFHGWKRLRPARIPHTSSAKITRRRIRLTIVQLRRLASQRTCNDMRCLSSPQLASLAMFREPFSSYRMYGYTQNVRNFVACNIVTNHTIHQREQCLHHVVQTLQMPPLETYPPAKRGLCSIVESMILFKMGSSNGEPA